MNGMLHRTLGFWQFAVKRLTSRPWLSVLLLLNTALSVGITLGIPVFSGAVSRRILQQEINARAQIRGWPLFSVRISAQPTERQPLGLTDLAATGAWLEDALRKTLRLPVTSVNVELQSVIYRLAPRPDDYRYTTEYLAGVQVVYVADIAEHIEVYAGAPFGELSDPTHLHVWLESAFAQDLALQVGDEYDLGDLFSSGGPLIPIKIAGFWQARNPTDHFWPRQPSLHFDGRFLVTAEQFEAFILQPPGGLAGSAAWYYVFDDQRVRLDRAEAYIAGLQHVTREAERRLPNARMDLDPGEDLRRGQTRKETLAVMLFGFSLPLLVILAHALASLSTIQNQLQEHEAAMLVSRGSKTWQLLALSACESLLLGGAALPLGALFALLLARLLGYATGFLTFALHDPLAVSLSAATWTPTFIVVMISLLVRLYVTAKTSGRTLIAYEQTHPRQIRYSSPLRVAWLAFLVLATVYAYQMLVNRGIVLTSLNALDPRNDPLVMLAPTLFIFTAPLLAAEVFAWLMVPIDLFGRFLPWISTYLAALNLIRAGKQYRASIYRLTLSLTLGVFYASVAKSADIWLTDSLQYRYGTDVILKLTAEPGDRFGTFGRSATEGVEIVTVPSDVYRDAPGVEAAARVAEFEATLQPSGGVSYYHLLAVERVNIPQVVYFRRDYAAESLGELMNRLALAPNGILLPGDIAARSWLAVGDTLNVSVKLYGETWVRFDGKVAGFFDYFPTAYPDGQPVIIANLDYLELRAGILPHDVWLKLTPGADIESALQYINRLGVPLRQVKDLPQALRIERQRLERTGLFGLLSFCFVAGVALSVGDVLVYTTALVRERALAHAVLRALGLRRRDILVSVVLEQIVSLIYGLAVGVVCGVQCALLYGPYFPLGSGSLPVPPFIAYVDWPRAWWMVVLTGATLFLAQGFVLWRMTRTHLFQALRMGMRP